jgi:hypothetical protein
MIMETPNIINRNGEFDGEFTNDFFYELHDLASLLRHKVFDSKKFYELLASVGKKCDVMQQEIDGWNDMMSGEGERIDGEFQEMMGGI